MLINHATCDIKAPEQELDLEGQRFGGLIALGHLHQRFHIVWVCQCDCGNMTITRAYRLIRGETTSCGCLRKRWALHGMARTPTYRSWSAMIQRCTNPNYHGYGDWGGRGITIYEPWFDFKQFLKDAGERPEPSEYFSLDRIDNNGNYEPGNVRWTDDRAQARNRRNTIMLTYKDRTQSLNDWADEVGIHPTTIITRIRRYNWPIEQALTTPPSFQSRKKRGLLPSYAEAKD